MAKTRGRLAWWGVVGLVVVVLATAVAAGAAWYRARSRRIELSEARQAMAAGRLGLARDRLTRLADRWPDDGDVLLLLGQCELQRSLRDDGPDPRAREAALAAWARVPTASPDFPLAALLQALQFIKIGRYSTAERLLDAALATRPPDVGLRYDLEPRLEPRLPLRRADG